MLDKGPEVFFVRITLCWSVWNCVREISSGLRECRPYSWHSQRRHKIHSLQRKKFCPGETRISEQLALQCLLLAGTGWSGVEVAASGSHLVSLHRKGGGSNSHLVSLEGIKRKAIKEELESKREKSWSVSPGELADGSVEDRPADPPLGIWPKTTPPWLWPKPPLWAWHKTCLQSQELDRRHGEPLQHPGRRSQGRYLFSKNISEDILLYLIRKAILIVSPSSPSSFYEWIICERLWL